MTLNTEKVLLRGSKIVRTMPVSTLASTSEEARKSGQKGHTRFNGRIIPLVYNEASGQWEA